MSDAQSESLPADNRRFTWLAWSALLAVAAGFALRLSNLAVQSLWFDEAISLWQAHEPVRAIVFDIEPAHLPTYFLALKLWTALAGSSEFSARYFSLASSLLAVPLAYWVAGLLGGRSFRAFAVMVFAIEPALIYYGQEVRMYAFLPAFGLLALGTYLAAAKRESPSITRWLAHGTAIALCCYTHYYGAVAELVSFALFGAAFIGLRGSDATKRSWLVRGWLGSQAVLALLFAPWLLIRATAASGVQSAFSADFSLAAYFWRAGVGLLLGHHLEQQTLVISDGLANENYWYALKLLVPLLILLVLGLLPATRRGTRTLWIAAGVPLVAVLLLTLSGRDFGSRYLFTAAPALWLLIAAGIDRLFAFRRALAFAGVAAFAVPAAFSFLSLSDPALAKEDNRSLAEYLSREAGADDLILLNASYNNFALDYYYPGPAKAVPMPSTYPADAMRTAAELTESSKNYRRFWLMLWQDYYSDPNGLVKGWLDANTFQFDAEVFHGLTLYGYLAKSPILQSLPPVTASNAQFGDIGLAGYTLQPVGPPNSSNEYRLQLYWTTTAQLQKSYRVFAHVVNPVYHVYAQKDNRPVFDRFPTTRWTPGTFIQDEYQLRLDPGTPPGEYQIAVGLYDEVTGARVRLQGSDRDYVLLGPIHAPESHAAPAPAHRLDVRFGNAVQLAGYDLEDRARAGDTLHLTLHWKATGAVPADLTVFNHVVDGSGKLVAQKDSQPADGAYPTGNWKTGVYIQDKYDIQLPADLPPGKYKLLSGMYSSGGERLPATPGQPDRSAVVAEFTVG